MEVTQGDMEKVMGAVVGMADTDGVPVYGAVGKVAEGHTLALPLKVCGLVVGTLLGLPLPPLGVGEATWVVARGEFVNVATPVVGILLKVAVPPLADMVASLVVAAGLGVDVPPLTVMVANAVVTRGETV